ncbi:MAG: hypothetical protein GY765_16905 [bacterium]|nr:hypothetical protein [bacterium]
MDNNRGQPTIGELIPALKNFSDFRIKKDNSEELIVERRRWLFTVPVLLNVGFVVYLLYTISGGLNPERHKDHIFVIFAFFCLLPLLSMAVMHRDKIKALFFGERYEFNRYKGELTLNGKRLLYLSEIESFGLVIHSKYKSEKSRRIEFRLHGGERVYILSTAFRKPLKELAEKLSIFLGKPFEQI